MSKNIEAIYKLSPLQQGLLFHSVSRPDEPTYFEQIRCRITGKLDIDCYEKAWNWVVMRHSALRTAFAWKRLSEPVQVVGRDVKLPLRFEDWQSRENASNDWKEFVKKDMEDGFELNQAPLMRLNLRKVAQDEYFFMWSHHHILLDGWSFGIVLQEVLNCYTSLVETGYPTKSKKVRPFKDFIQFLESQDSLNDRSFWKNYLQGIEYPTRLDVDMGQGVQEGGVETILSTKITSKSSSLIQSKCNELGVSLSALIHAAWAKVLCSYSNKYEVVFGSTTAGRPPELQGVEDMVGLFINAVPLRVKIEPHETVSSLLLNVQRDLFQLQSHQFLGLSSIQELTAVKAGQPLFESILSYQNYPLDAGHTRSWAGMNIADYEWSGPTNYPLAVRAFPGEQIMLVMTFYGHRIPDYIASDMLDQFQLLVEGLGMHPERKLWEFEAVTGHHAKKILGSWNKTDNPINVETTLHELAETQAQIRPADLAVIAGDGQLTYGELDKKANKLARHLIKIGVAPGSIVGLCAEKSTLVIVAMLAVMKAGAAYLPLDPSYPKSRIAYMCEDAGLSAVLTWGKGTKVISELDVQKFALDTDWTLLDKNSDALVNMHVSPKALAYVIYTSGSSGKPKGVMVNHKGRVNNISDYCQRFDIKETDKTICVSSLSFDISVCDIFCSIKSGGCLIFPSCEREKDPLHWLELIESNLVTIWHSAPMLMEALLEESALQPKINRSLKLVILDGDWIPVSQPNKVREVFQSADVVSAGGATELSIDSVVYPIEDVDPKWNSIPYGKPMSNQTAYILDDLMRVAPIGVSGELYLGGIGIADGYLHRPSLTAEKFVPNPWSSIPGERIYRTGDLAKFGADGTIELLGRIDFQVKIRGIRIELGEIKACLNKHDYVESCIVSAFPDHNGEKRLVAYWVASHADYDESSSEHLKQWIREYLPEQLVPELFMKLKSLPISPNGKVNRRNLPEPKIEILTSVKNLAATELEKTIADVWANVLGLDAENLDIDMSFFDLGGNSLKAIRACRLPDCPIAISTLYECQTIRKIAEYIEAKKTGNIENVLIPLNKSNSDIALICVPYGGGHAGVYQDLAHEVKDNMRLYSVNLPGHSFDQSKLELEPISKVAQSVLESVQELKQGPVLIYGHCGGVALATEIAHLLESNDFDVIGLVVAAAYPPEDLSIFDKNVYDGISDFGLAETFIKLGGFKGLNEEEIRIIGSLLRHDGSEAQKYFKGLLSQKAPKLKTKLTCLIGQDDPLTSGYEREWRSWRYVAKDHQVKVISGGHYFVREHPGKVASELFALLSD